MDPLVQSVLEKLKLAILRYCEALSFRELKANQELVWAFEDLDDLFRQYRVPSVD